MSKELTPLEAFYELGDNTPITETWKIVETALKNYEELAQKYNELLYNYQELVNCGLKSEQKKIKTFEIIKEKNVDIRGIKETKDFNEYNVKFPTTLNEFLEEQEYCLLKEVLLCEF